MAVPLPFRWIGECRIYDDLQGIVSAEPVSTWAKLVRAIMVADKFVGVGGSRAQA